MIYLINKFNNTHFSLLKNFEQYSKMKQLHVNLLYLE